MNTNYFSLFNFNDLFLDISSLCFNELVKRNIPEELIRSYKRILRGGALLTNCKGGYQMVYTKCELYKVEPPL